MDSLAKLPCCEVRFRRCKPGLKHGDRCFGALSDGALSGIRTHTERCLRPRSLPVGVPGLIFLTRERLPHGIVRLNRRLGV